MGCMIYSLMEDHFVKCVCITCTHYGLGWEMQKVEKSSEEQPGPSTGLLAFMVLPAAINTSEQPALKLGPFSQSHSLH